MVLVLHRNCCCCRSAFLHNSGMTVITKEILSSAIVDIGAMNLRQREQLTDEIHAKQPQLLASVLALRSFGVTFEQLDVPLNILLVCHQSMKATGRVWPVINDDRQERGIKRVIGRISFIEGLAAEQVAQAVSAFVTEHKEQWLLAFVFGEQRANNVMQIETETERFVVLAAPNLVECIAEAGEMADDTQEAFQK